MAIKTKSPAEVAAKWGEVTPGRSRFYEANAGAAGEDWARNTEAAAAAFAAAVTSGNIKQMFSGGVRRAGAAKYTRKVKDVGVSRFGQGVGAAVQDMAAGIEPFLTTIAGLTLPARAPRGSEANLERVRVIAQALTKKRLALRSAGG